MPEKINNGFFKSVLWVHKKYLCVVLKREKLVHAFWGKLEEEKRSAIGETSSFFLGACAFWLSVSPLE